MLRTGSKVIVFNAPNKKGISVYPKSYFVGHTGVIIKDWRDILGHEKDPLRFVLEFDEPEYEEANKRVGKYLWKEENLLELTEENKNYIR